MFTHVIFGVRKKTLLSLAPFILYNFIGKISALLNKKSRYLKEFVCEGVEEKMGKSYKETLFSIIAFFGLESRIFIIVLQIKLRNSFIARGL